MSRSTWVVRAGVLALLALLRVDPAQAQEAASGTITGVVRSAATNKPLQGVQVAMAQPDRGVLTNQSGAYTFENVAPGVYEIEVRSIGYENQVKQVTVAPGETVRADFMLRESAIALEGIVVTGQGTATEVRKLSATVNVLNTKKIDEAPVTDVSQLLQGRVPGATVNATSAQPGQAGLVRFRGVTSVFGSQTPVIYVDGVRVDNSSGKGLGTGGEQTSALSDILASDIERIEILKGGAAATLYGSDAATGVIQIFTKKGVAGRPRVTARVEQGLDTPDTKYIKDVGFAFPDLVEEQGVNPNLVKDELLQDGHLQNYYVSVSGGSEDATYNVSGRVQDNTGVQIKNGSTIYALRGGVKASVNDDLSLDFSGSYTHNQFQRLFNGTAISDPLTAFEVGDALYFSKAETLEEALRIFTMPDIGEEVNRFVFGTTATYRPAELFTSRATIGVDYRSSEQRIFEPLEFVITDDVGRIDRYNRNYTAITLDVAGTFSWPREGTVTSEFTLGAQGFREDESQIWASGRNFALPGTGDLDAAAMIEAFESNVEVFNGGFYALERIGLWDRVFLDAAVRFDGNSAFGEDVGLQAYPKLGIAYTLSEEPFWREGIGSYVNALKLRAAYGQTGKFPTAFSRDRTFSATPFRGESAPRFSNPGNLELRPEVVSTFEAGFDAGLLDNRVGINFTYYDATTADALFFVDEQPATGGFSQLRNVGEIRNRGVELAVNLGLLRTKNVDWDFSATYNTVENEVTDMGGIPEFSLDLGRRVAEGYPVGTYFVTVPVDTNGDGLLDGSERQFVGGQPFPTRTGSFMSELTLFGSLTLNALADWATGATVLDYGSAWATYNGLERITFPTQYSLEGEELGPYFFTEAFSSLLLDGDYFKLREMSVRYTLPEALTERWGGERASLYLTGRNLYTWVPEKQCSFAPDCLSNLVDPELSGVASDDLGSLQLGGATSITLPAPRQFRVGVEVSF